MFVFTTALTSDYLWRAAPLLASLHLLRSCRCWVATVNFANMPPGRGYRTVPLESARGCNQQGQVLDVVNVMEGEVLIQADADAVIQRDFSTDEKALLAELRPGLVALGPNGAGRETGEVEYHRLLPHCSIEDVNRRLGVRLDQVEVFNAGFIAAVPAVWRELRQYYEVMYAAGAHLFGNWRCCQLLLCCAIWNLGLSVIRLPRTLHAHWHFGRSQGDEIKDGKLYAGGELVAYAHHVPGVTEFGV